MHRLRSLPIQTASAVVPGLQNFKNASKLHSGSGHRLKQLYALSNTAQYSTSWQQQPDNNKTTQRLSITSSPPPPPQHSYNTSHNTFNNNICLQTAGSANVSHLLTSSLLIAPITCPNQHRHYSSLTDLCKQYLSVSAAEPIPDVTAESSAAASAVPSITANATDGIEYIPLPPTMPLNEIDPSTLTALGEPTLASLGMAGYTPVGIIQSAIENIHVYLDLPWWGSIVLVTVVLRSLMFPLVILAQRNAAKLNNVSPQMQCIQMKLTEAREAGNNLEVSRLTSELVLFMKEKNVNPIKSMIVPLAQAPIFISMFMGLRKCASLPVMSFTTGGMLWFTDLTLADPYYLLPVITSATMWLTIKVGADVGRLQAAGENAHLIYKFLSFTPIIFLPFMANFPAAVLCYWFASNVVSLGQAGLLKVPAVRDFFNIPRILKHNPDSLPLTKKNTGKSTLQSAKDSWRNMKVSREMEDRQRYDEVRFQKAGSGPVVRTYKYDPTKGKAKTKASQNIITTSAKFKY